MNGHETMCAGEQILKMCGGVPGTAMDGGGAPIVLSPKRCNNKASIFSRQTYIHIILDI